MLVWNGFHAAILSEQVASGLREADEGAALMQFEPAEGNRAIEARRIFSGCPTVTEQERRVEMLDIDAALLHWFEGPRVLHQATRSFFRISEGALVGELHAATLSSLSAPRITILSASSGNGRCNALASSHGACIHTSRSSSMVRIDPGKKVLFQFF